MTDEKVPELCDQMDDPEPEPEHDMEPESRVFKILRRNANLPEQKTQEWLDQRFGMITASDISSVLGVPGSFGTRADVICKKLIPEKRWSSRATQHGEFYESWALREYERLTGAKVFELGCLQHPKYPFIGASPDGITTTGIAIEIKCPYSRKITPGKIPIKYYCQVQTQLEVLDVDVCHFVQYKPGNTRSGPEISIDVVHRDRDWFARALPQLRRTWEEIQKEREGLGIRTVEDTREFDELKAEGIRSEILGRESVKSANRVYKDNHNETEMKRAFLEYSDM